jgi:transposase InsO family protein
VLDFVHDQLATGTKLRVLTIVDTFSRFAPAIERRFNLRGADVVDVLERFGREIGYPAAIRVDHASKMRGFDQSQALGPLLELGAITGLLDAEEHGALRRKAPQNLTRAEPE